MEQYISKSALVAEFNRLIAELVEEKGTMFEQGRISAFEDAKLFLDTLEVKEVDIKKEVMKFMVSDVCQLGEENGCIIVAKHFFELGLRAQKGE